MILFAFVFTTSLVSSQETNSQTEKIFSLEDAKTVSEVEKRYHE
jgi:hypothetical protein